MDGGVRHPAADASLRIGEAAELGAKLSAQHSTKARASVLVSCLAHLQPLPPILRGRFERSRARDAEKLQSDPVRAVLGEPRLPDEYVLGLRRSVRHRREVRRHPRVEPRRDGQYRLRSSRGGRSAGKPHSLQPLLSREAWLLPRERRHLRDGHRRFQESHAPAFLQPPHRYRPVRRARPHQSGREAERKVGALQHRSDEHANGCGGRRHAREQFHRRGRPPRAFEPL